MSGGDDWRAGDLALCVRPSRTGVLTVGRTYGVNEVFVHSMTRELCLGVDGIPTYQPGRYLGHRADRFIKATPPKADEFDRETIALLTGKPVRAPA